MCVCVCVCVGGGSRAKEKEACWCKCTEVVKSYPLHPLSHCLHLTAYSFTYLKHPSLSVFL